MGEGFVLEVITPDRVLYRGRADMAEFVTTEGEIGIYRNHIPLTAVLAPGVLRIHEEEQVKRAALHSGFVKILPNSVTILAETAEWSHEIDKTRAEEARRRAENAILNGGGGRDVSMAELALKRAIARLEAKS